MINEASLDHFEEKPQSSSPKKTSRNSSPGKGKGKAGDVDDDDDEDSGDEAEKLNDDQMHELDTIYKRWVTTRRSTLTA